MILTGIPKKTNLAFHPVRIRLVSIYWSACQHGVVESKNPNLTSPHLNILGIQHQGLHSRIEIRERIHQLLRQSTGVPAILTHVVVGCWIEAVTAHDFAVAAGRHDNLVDSECAPVLDCFV